MVVVMNAKYIKFTAAVEINTISAAFASHSTSINAIHAETFPELADSSGGWVSSSIFVQFAIGTDYKL